MSTLVDLSNIPKGEFNPLCGNYMYWHSYIINSKFRMHFKHNTNEFIRFLMSLNLPGFFQYMIAYMETHERPDEFIQGAPRAYGDSGVTILTSVGLPNLDFTFDGSFSNPDGLTIQYRAQNDLITRDTFCHIKLVYFIHKDEKIYYLQCYSKDIEFSLNFYRIIDRYFEDVYLYTERIWQERKSVIILHDLIEDVHYIEDLESMTDYFSTELCEIASYLLP